MSFHCHRRCRGYLIAATAAASLFFGVSAAQAQDTPSAAVQNRIIADAIFKSGVQASRMGDYTRAIILLSKAVEMDPSLADCYRERGNAYLMRAAAWEKIAQISEQIQNDPEALDALMQRAAALYNVGDYEAASADLNTVLERDPDMAEAYRQRGLLQIARGRYEQAADDYRQFIYKLMTATPPARLPRQPGYRPDIL
jgi:tetratricopeptide (TPR) repeat protein